MLFVKAVISLENIQLRRYALEPVGTLFLRWCLLFPSCFFGDFVGALARRYADTQIGFPCYMPKQSMLVIPVDLNHPTASTACRMAGEQMPRAPLCKSLPQVAKMKAKAVMHGALAAAASVATVTGAAACPVAVFACAGYTATVGNIAMPALSINSSSSSASDDLKMTGGNCAALGRKSTGLTDLTDSPPYTKMLCQE